MFQNPTLKLAVGISAISLAGVLMYIYYKNKDDDEDELDGLKLSKDTSKKKEQKDILLRMVVANDKVALIAGRSGANLKMIENKSETCIQFKQKDDNNQWCEIRGKIDAVNEAKELINKDINRLPQVKEEIFVPQSACGKIIGRCGESLQEICRLSLAKISVDSGDRCIANDSRRVVITGYPHQVDHAKKLIEEKVQEDKKYRLVIEELESRREPRRSPSNSLSNSMHSSMTSLPTTSYLPSKEKLSDHDNKAMEVYVSAIASPAKFWLQIIGPQTKSLDDLVETMTEYYNKSENKKLHQISEPYLGQIVASILKYDGKWYRGEICAILPNEYNPKDVVYDIYYVDYGDSEYLSPSDVFELNTDFLRLRFQAIECYLAHVKPIMSQDPDDWDQASTEKLVELTHVASWKKLKSRIVTYKERPRGGNQIRREGSPVPGVELYDIIEGNEINIAHMLISHGFAMPDYPQQQSELQKLSHTPRNLSRENSETSIENKTNLKKSSEHPTFLNGDNKTANGTHNIQHNKSVNETNSFLRNEISNGNSSRLNKNLNEENPVSIS